MRIFCVKSQISDFKFGISNLKSLFTALLLATLPFAAQLIAPANAQAADKTPQVVTSIEGITELRLDNGLKVLLFPDPSKPTVTVNLTVFVGSRHEGYGEIGRAHV